LAACVAMVAAVLYIIAFIGCIIGVVIIVYLMVWASNTTCSNNYYSNESCSNVNSALGIIGLFFIVLVLIAGIITYLIARAEINGNKSFNQRADIGLSGFIAWNLVAGIFQIIGFIIDLSNGIAGYGFVGLIYAAGSLFLYWRGKEFQALLHSKKNLQAQFGSGPTMIVV